jgi:hypothetical protein
MLADAYDRISSDQYEARYSRSLQDSVSFFSLGDNSLCPIWSCPHYPQSTDCQRVRTSGDRSITHFGVLCRAGGLGYFHTSSSSLRGASGTLLVDVDICATLNGFMDTNRLTEVSIRLDDDDALLQLVPQCLALVNLIPSDWYELFKAKIGLHALLHTKFEEDSYYSLHPPLLSTKDQPQHISRSQRRAWHAFSTHSSPNKLRRQPSLYQSSR